MKNVILRRTLVIIFVIVSFIVLVFYCVKMINNTKVKNNNNVFDLGFASDVLEYEDVIINNYDELLKLTSKYDISSSLTEEDFVNNNYLASFVDYDSCGEKSFKTVEDISYSDAVQVTYKVYNKCGFCKKHVVLHLLKIDKVNLDYIEYTYIYENENLKCKV